MISFKIPNSSPNVNDNYKAYYEIRYDMLFVSKIREGPIKNKCPIYPEDQNTNISSNV